MKMKSISERIVESILGSKGVETAKKPSATQQMADAAWQSVRLQEKNTRIALFGAVLAASAWLGFTGEDIVRHATAIISRVFQSEPEARELDWELVTDASIDFNLIR